jgi:hypothetical protein
MDRPDGSWLGYEQPEAPDAHRRAKYATPNLSALGRSPPEDTKRFWLRSQSERPQLPEV